MRQSGVGSGRGTGRGTGTRAGAGAGAGGAAESGFVLIAVVILVLPLIVAVASLSTAKPDRDVGLLDRIARERALLAAEAGMDQAVFEANRDRLPVESTVERTLGHRTSFSVRARHLGRDGVDSDGDGRIDEDDEDVLRLIVVGRCGEVERELAAQVHRRQGDGRYGEFRGWVELTPD